jgi:hypothetical protein
MSKWLSKHYDNFIVWSQNASCLVCDYSLHLRANWHHIIARDDLGPDHYLNIVALCPNHHYLLEHLKREIIPHEKRSSDNWLIEAKAAQQLYNKLQEDVRELFDILSKPHRLTEPIKSGIPQHLIEAFIIDVIKTDLSLLHYVNMKRPRIFSKFNCAGSHDNDHGLDVIKVAKQISATFYTEVISAHLANLHLPYWSVKSYLEQISFPGL